jgi:hypothetical protein
MTTPDLKGALERMKTATRGHRRRGPVYEWLAARYDGLEAAFRTSQPSWKALADYLAEGGVMGADGVPISPPALRATWLRVQAEVTRRRARSKPPDTAPQSATSDPIAPAADYEEYDWNQFVKEKK